ncbi:MULTISPECIES: hypothetical protein [Streptomyces]|uniref:hypothetical protein n=1 Tax=Streptomyces TaxID=1883 RepID=UPI001F41369D|nr:hypothetical protein [Streptomyces sp. A1-5]UJB44805.1 hypothetical protein HRD51_32015 [Streptomyces sp. A1-5]
MDGLTVDQEDLGDAGVEILEAVHRIGVELPRMLLSGDLIPAQAQRIAVAVNGLLDDLGVHRPAWDDLRPVP